MSTNPTLIPNIAMSATVAPEDMTRRSERIKGVPTSLVHIDTARMRRLDTSKVGEMAASIKEHGLLQPIGVQQKKAELGKIQSGYRLIYGRHRLAAIQQLFDDGIPGADTVPCVIYPSNMPEDAMLLDEIVENLHRKELTPAERAAHSAKYAGLLKRGNAVQGGDKKRSATQKPRDVCSTPEHTSPIIKPTVTEKIGKDLGISRGTVHHRINIAVKLAEQQGVKINGKKSVEAMDADTLIHVGDAALNQARNKIEKAKVEGKPEDQIDPYRTGANRNYWLNMSKLPESLDGHLGRQWNRSDSPLSAGILDAASKILQKWADRWREREG